MDIPKTETVAKGELKCCQCEFCQIEGDGGYYPHLRCMKNMQEISFNNENGWEVMKWCPIIRNETMN